MRHPSEPRSDAFIAFHPVTSWVSCADSIEAANIKTVKMDDLLIIMSGYKRDGQVIKFRPQYNKYHLCFDFTEGFVNIAGSINSVRWRPQRQGKRKGFSF